MKIRFPLSLSSRGVNFHEIIIVRRRIKARTRSFLIGLALLGVLPSTNAAWTLYQNFESLPVDYNIADDANPNENFTVSTQDIANSAARYGGYTVITDPTNPANQALDLNAVGWAFTGQFVDAATGTPAPIANLTTATLFYRVYRTTVSNTPDVNLGAADIGTITDGANNAANFQSQLNVSGGSLAAGTTDIFRPRNGGGTVDTGVHWLEGMWFGIFQVIDAASNTSLFFYQSELDSEPILLFGQVSGTSNMAFRNGGSRPDTDLTNFLATNGLPGGGVNDIFYLDDIYLDLSGENLVSPVPIVSVPEPATTGLVLASLCGLAVMARSCRRSR
jgi:hypothetical protein